MSDVTTQTGPADRSNTPAAVLAREVNRSWRYGRIAESRTGFSARLTEKFQPETAEISRRACESTHVVSVWLSGSTFSELHLDGKQRFARTREGGSFQLARAGESLRAVLSKASGRCLDLYLPTSLIQSTLEYEFGGAPPDFQLQPLGVEQDPDIYRTAQAVAREIESRQVGGAAALDSAALGLTSVLIRRWSNLSPRHATGKAALSPSQLRRAIAYLNDNLTVDISLADLADAVGLSTFHFARSFKSATGVPPYRYLLALRIERAKDLLANSPLSISDVAAAVGYEDQSQLARLFRKDVGLTPSQYRTTRRS